MRYDVFISYSQSSDGLMSERLQDGLTRFAKPWWRRRALSVFRDRTGLTANPGLWSSIADAIDNSRYFLMLASPEAAASPWVAREVAQWRTQHGSENLLVLLADGEIVWSDRAGDFDWTATTALGQTFAGCFAEAPRYVDMRWARSEVQLDLTDGRFRDQIAEVAAPIHGMAKDELAGADVRQHRRTLRHAFAAAVALALLTIAAVTSTAFALNTAATARRSAARARSSAAQARTEQQRADVQARLASLASGAATKAGKLAEQRRKEADHSAKVAEQSAHEAQLERGVAQLSADQARFSAAEAQVQRAAAIVSADEAQVQRAAALVSADRAQAQRAAAIASEDEATRSRLLADARGNDLAVETARLKQTNGKLNQTVGDLVDQQHATEHQRLAAVVRRLIAESQFASASGDTDHATLFATEASNFQSQSAGLVSDTDVKANLVGALQANPRLIGKLRGLDGGNIATAVAPDGSRAVGVSTHGRAAIWQLPSRRLLATFPIAISGSNFVVAFIDPNTVVVALDWFVDAYRSADGGRTWTHAWSRFLRSNATAIAATPTHVLIGGANHYGPEFGDLDIFDVSGRQVTTPVDCAPDLITFAPPVSVSGVEFAIACFDGVSHTSIEVYRQGSVSTETFGVDDRAVDLRFSSDASQLTLLGGKQLYGWDLGLGGRQIAPLSNWSTIVRYTPIGLSPDLDAIVQRDPGRPDLNAIGHIYAGTFTATLDAPLDPVVSLFYPVARAATFTPDGNTVLLSGGDSMIPLFDIQDNANSRIARSRSLSGPPGDRGPVALSRDGTMAAAASTTTDGAVLRLTTLNGSARPIDVTLARPPGAIWRDGSEQLTFNDQGDGIAVVGVDGSVDVYDTSTGARTLHLPPDSGGRIAFSGSLSSGKIATIGYPTSVRSWDLRSGKVVANHVFNFGTALEPESLRMNDTGSRLAVTTVVPGTSYTIHVLDAIPGGWTEHASFAMTGDVSSSLVDDAMSRDGSRFAVTDNESRLVMYDLDQRRMLWTETAHLERPWIGSHGALYTATIRGEIKVRSPETGAVLYSLDPTFIVPDGRDGTFAPPVAVVDADSHVIAAFGPPNGIDRYNSQFMITDYPLAISDLNAATCRTAGRNLTRAEWAQYVSTVDAYEKTCPDLR